MNLFRNFPFAESLKKGACRYLIHHYLGTFLAEKLSLDQLSIDISSGCGKVTNIEIDSHTINETLQGQNIPLEILDGTVGEISVSIPWKALTSESSVVEIKDLVITVSPRTRQDPMVSSQVLDSMFSSMVTSMEIAENCVKETQEKPDATEGVQLIANTIDAVLARVKVIFTNVRITMKYTAWSLERDVDLELTVQRAEYFDCASDGGTSCSEDGSKPSMSNLQIYKNLHLFGVAFTLNDFAQSKSRPSSHFAPRSPYSSQFSSPSQGASPRFDSDTQSRSDVKEKAPLKIAQFFGKTELKLTLRRESILPGPRFECYASATVVHVLLTPSQLHLLISCAEAFSQSARCHTNSSSSMQSPQNTWNEKVATAQLQKLVSRRATDIDLSQDPLGMSSQSCDFLTPLGQPGVSEDNEDFFYSCAPPVGSSTYSTTSDTTATTYHAPHWGEVSQGDAVGHGRSGHQRTRKSSTHDKFKKRLEDKMSKVASCQIQLGVASITLLHEDPSTTPSDGIDPEITAAEKCEQLFGEFFRHVAHIDINTCLREIRERLAEICCTDHTGLLAKPVMMNLQVEESSQICKSNLVLSFGMFELTETLMECKRGPSLSIPKPKDLEPVVSDIIVFPHQNIESESPSVRIVVSSIQDLDEFPTGTSEKNRIEVRLELSDFVMDVDITLMDRIYRVINPLLQRSNQRPAPSLSQFHYYPSSLSVDSGSLSRYDVHISSNEAVFQLRFPIPDLRQRKERPWYKKTLRREFMQLLMRKLSFHTMIKSDNLETLTFDLTCTDLSAGLSAGDNLRQVLRVSGSGDGQVTDWPRVVIRTYPRRNHSLVMEPSQSLPAEESLPGNWQQQINKLSPFSTKKIMYDDLQQILPGSQADIENFISRSSENTASYVEIHLPVAFLNLHEKDFCELLYNRLCNDLLLWESLAPTTVHVTQNLSSLGAPDSLPYGISAADFISPAEFPARQDCSNNSDSDSSDKESYKDTKTHQTPNTVTVSSLKQSIFCFKLTVDKGRITGQLPLKINPDDEVFSSKKFGGFILDVEDGSMFLDSGHDGDPFKLFMTIQTKKAHLYHAACLVKSAFVSDIFNDFSTEVPEGFAPVITPTSYGLSRSHQTPTSMLTAVMEATEDRQKYQKAIVFSLLLGGGTLNYKMQELSELWITQFIDFLDLKDYSIEGYKPPRVQTGLHLSFSSCAVDYKPLFFQQRTVVCLDSVYLSSSVITENSSVLRFLAEGGSLYITDKVGPEALNIRTDFAHVLEVDVLDFELCFNELSKRRQPMFEFRSSGHTVNIHLCSDSLQQLMGLIEYITLEGDFPEKQVRTKEKLFVPGEECQQPKLGMADIEGDDCLSKSIIINTQLQDAISDETARKRSLDSSSGSGSSDDSLGFLVVNEPGLGLSVKKSEFEFKSFTKDPLKIVETHFPVPIVKLDRLKEPAQLGLPIERYSVRDLSVVVHLYAGSDFPKLVKSSGKVAVQSLSAVSYSASPSKTSSSMSQGRQTDNCMEVHLDKLSFRHSVFPESSGYVSRQVFLIQDVEIKDKISSSPINSFLYRFSSDAMPRVTNSPMVCIKASHLRPETPKHNQECLLYVSLQPIRLNIDQDALFFLKSFFSSLSSSLSQPSLAESDSRRSSSSDLLASTPVCSVDTSAKSPSASMSQEALGLYFDELEEASLTAQDLSKAETVSGHPTYFRSFLFSPEVYIRLDYNGGRFNVSEGTLGGLVAGLMQFSDAELRLRRLHYKSGLLGIDKLFAYALGEWARDIRNRQMPGILSGLGPAHIVLQFLAGVRDLFWLPLDTFLREGLLVRGLQRGTRSFLTCSGLAFLDLTGRFLSTLQTIAVFSQDLLSPQPLEERRRKRRKARRPGLPIDLRQGLSSASEALHDVAAGTAVDLRAAACDSGMVGILRHVPGSVMTPVVGLAQAGGYLVRGMHNQLQPEALQEQRQKWKESS